MKYAYIAGPMSGHDDFNFPAFFEAADKVRAMGYSVFNPAEEDLKEWGTLEEVKTKANYRTCLRKDLIYLIDNPNVKIFLLPGWERSKGVAVEIALAKALNLEVEELK